MTTTAFTDHSLLLEMDGRDDVDQDRLKLLKRALARSEADSVSLARQPPASRGAARRP